MGRGDFGTNSTPLAGVTKHMEMEGLNRFQELVETYSHCLNCNLGCFLAGKDETFYRFHITDKCSSARTNIYRITGVH